MEMIGVLFVLIFVVISNGQMMMGMGGMLDFSGMIDSFKGMAAQFEKMKKIKPWYQGPNACFSDSFRDDPFFILGSMPFEMCHEMGFRRICSSRVFIKGQAMERIRMYQCCHGAVFKNVDGWMQCVKRKK
ncbi:hypothetical protein JTE90_024903 [Oedothorax gibbosus]|uniref:Uncharacterized protein n=1 Tax=Oedothorax gibbosus TaxID=931172 RepID=A0AAV6U509_9ARAC|nr:hypothetical protein JTE90_024903 [Oedothorax gibbosus]